jgi:TonB family protein
MTRFSSRIGLLATALSIAAQPAEFYIVSEATSDASPFWFNYVLHVAGDGQDSVVRHLRIAPGEFHCAESVTIKAVTTRLAGVKPADLLAAYPVCSVNQESLAKKLRGKVPPVTAFEAVQFGIVARCGERNVAIQLPSSEQVNLKRLKRWSPDLSRWWDLVDTVKDRAIGLKDSFHEISAAQDLELQRAGSRLVAELRSGRFDEGLRPNCPSPGGKCQARSFRDDLVKYAGILDNQRPTPRLVQTYKFDQYVAPRYPPLALQARIQGTVKLELTLDSKSGAVQQATALQGGHPILRDAAVLAARQWIFTPSEIGEHPDRIPAEIVFDLGCPPSPKPN